MKTAVIYARYSSERQTEQSIEGQIRECTEYAKYNDILIVDTYNHNHHQSFHMIHHNHVRCDKVWITTPRLDGKARGNSTNFTRRGLFFTQNTEKAFSNANFF